MGPSIKKQIFDRLLQNLQPLKDGQRFASVTRELDPLKVTKAMPSLSIYDLPESEVSRDNIGRTYTFDLVLKIVFEHPTDLAGLKDTLVPEVQALMETDIQLGGLAVVVDGGAEEPMISETTSPMGAAILTYTVQYRRKRGDPTTTY